VTVLVIELQTGLKNCSVLKNFGLAGFNSFCRHARTKEQSHFPSLLPCGSKGSHNVQLPGKPPVQIKPKVLKRVGVLNWSQVQGEAISFQPVKQKGNMLRFCEINSDMQASPRP